MLTVVVIASLLLYGWPTALIFLAMGVLLRISSWLHKRKIRRELGVNLDSAIDLYNYTVLGYTAFERRRLHSMPYKMYLKTQHWHMLQAAVYERERNSGGKDCQDCGDTYHLQVHHTTYARRGYEDLDDVRLVCRHCHEVRHGLAV